LTAFKETEQRYSKWDKRLLSLVRAVKQVEALRGNPSGKTPLRLVLFSLSRNDTGNEAPSGVLCPVLGTLVQER